MFGQVGGRTGQADHHDQPLLYDRQVWPPTIQLASISSSAMVAKEVEDVLYETCTAHP